MDNERKQELFSRKAWLENRIKEIHDFGRIEGGLKRKLAKHIKELNKVVTELQLAGFFQKNANE